MEDSGRPFRPSIIHMVLILGLVAFAVYFLFFINPYQVADVLSKTNLMYYSAAFAAYATYSVFSSMVWQGLLTNLSVRITAQKALLFTWVGLFFEATVPEFGLSGEVSKTYMLTKDTNLDAGKIGASVIGQKIFSITLTVAGMTLGLVLVLVSYRLPLIVTSLISVVLILSILALSLLYFISLKPSATKTLLNWAVRIISFFRKRWNPQNFKTKSEELLERFHLGMSELRMNPKALVKPAAYAVLGFICEISVTFVVFAALGYPVPVDKVLIVFTLTGALQTVAFAFFGFPELIMSISYTALGIPVAISVSATLLTRVVSFWFRLVVSYTALQWAGIKILRQKQ